MCVAVPGKILEIDGHFALVDFNGAKRKVIISLVKNPEIGQYVIVHAGYAIEVMDEEQAREALNIFEEIIEKDILD